MSSEQQQQRLPVNGSHAVYTATTFHNRDNAGDDDMPVIDTFPPETILLENMDKERR